MLKSARPAVAKARELSQALKINPNTAQEVVAELVRDRLLEVRPGIGTVVAAALTRRASAIDRRFLLSDEVEQLVVEAKRLGLRKQELVNAVAALLGANGFGKTTLLQILMGIRRLQSIRAERFARFRAVST